MAVRWCSTAHRSESSELVAGYGAQVSRIGALAAADYPNRTGWYCDDSSSGAVTVLQPESRRTRPAGTPDKEWLITIFEIAVAMDTETFWNFARTSLQAANRPSGVNIDHDAGGTYKLKIVDFGDATLATGSTSLSVDTAYVALLLADSSGANELITVWLWNGSTWVQEATYTGGGVGGLWSGFGHARDKGVEGSGGVFIVANIYSLFNIGSYENSKPSEPRYLLGTDPITGSPAHDEWPGNYADVDDAPGHDGDTTYDESGTGTAVERQTYVMSNPTIPGGDTVAAVACYTVARLESGVGGDCDTIFHLSGVDQFVSYALNPASEYGPRMNCEERNPSAAVWGADVDGVELGARRQAAASDPCNLRATHLFGYAAYYTPAVGAARRIFIC